MTAIYTLPMQRDVASRGLDRPPGKLARLWTRGVRYGRLVPRDAAQIVREHLAGGVPVARCRV